MTAHMAARWLCGEFPSAYFGQSRKPMKKNRQHQPATIMPEDEHHQPIIHLCFVAKTKVKACSLERSRLQHVS